MHIAEAGKRIAKRLICHVPGTAVAETTTNMDHRVFKVVKNAFHE